MRHPIDFSYTTGKTLTAEFRDSTGVVLSQAMTEDAATGYYFITAATLAAPTLPAGTYSVRISEPTDGVVASGGLNWDGTAEVFAPTTAEIEAALVNEGDATALLQAIADKIAGDLTAGDLTAVAIASAVRTNLATELGRIDEAISSRLASSAFDDLGVDGTVNDASATINSFTVAGFPLTMNNYAKQYLVFPAIGDNLDGQAIEILANSSGTTVQLKDALPEAPANGRAIKIGGRAR